MIVNKAPRQRSIFLSKLKDFVPNLQNIESSNERVIWKGDYQEDENPKYQIKYQYDKRGDRLSFTLDNNKFLNIHLIFKRNGDVDVDRDNKQILEDNMTRKILEDVKRLIKKLGIYYKID